MLVGAEGVVENGGIINKLGTYQLAICAKAHNIPFYAAAESYKVPVPPAVPISLCSRAGELSLASWVGSECGCITRHTLWDNVAQSMHHLLSWVYRRKPLSSTCLGVICYQVAKAYAAVRACQRIINVF